MSTTPEPASVAAAKEEVVAAAREWSQEPREMWMGRRLAAALEALEATEQQAAPAAPRYTKYADCAGFVVRDNEAHALLDLGAVVGAMNKLALLNAREPAPVPDATLREAAETVAREICKYRQYYSKEDVERVAAKFMDFAAAIEARK